LTQKPRDRNETNKTQLVTRVGWKRNAKKNRKRKFGWRVDGGEVGATGEGLQGGGEKPITWLTIARDTPGVQEISRIHITAILGWWGPRNWSGTSQIREEKDKSEFQEGKVGSFGNEEIRSVVGGGTYGDHWVKAAP